MGGGGWVGEGVRAKDTFRRETKPFCFGKHTWGGDRVGLGGGGGNMWRCLVQGDGRADRQDTDFVIRDRFPSKNMPFSHWETRFFSPGGDPPGPPLEGTPFLFIENGRNLTSAGARTFCLRISM